MAQENLNPQNHGESRDQNATRETPAQAEGAHSTSKKSNRGFASMDPAKQREIASKGGRAAHEKGTAHQFSADEAREAGKKGGGAVSRDRHHMAEIGRVGGQSRGRKQRANATESTSSDKDQSAQEVKGEKPDGEYSH